MRRATWRMLARIGHNAARSQRTQPQKLKETTVNAFSRYECSSQIGVGALRSLASDATGSGSAGDETASSASNGTDSGAAPSPTVDGEDSASGSGRDSDGDGGEIDEDDMIDNMTLTEKGYRRALTAEHTVMPRPNRRPTRAEKGTYTNNADLAQEISDIAIRVPEDKPVYDLREFAPHLYEPKSEELEEMLAQGEEKFEEMLKQNGWDEGNMEGIGQRPIFSWLVRMRLDTSGMPNPVNRKVVCTVYLRELQEQRGLTDLALQHIALVAGPRYNPKTGLLRMSCEVHPKREDNRIHIMDLINNLVEEGNRVHPAPGGLNNSTPAERKEEAFEEYFAALWDELDLEGSTNAGQDESTGSDSGDDRSDDTSEMSGSSSKETHAPV